MNWFWQNDERANINANYRILKHSERRWQIKSHGQHIFLNGTISIKKNHIVETLLSVKNEITKWIYLDICILLTLTTTCCEQFYKCVSIWSPALPASCRLFYVSCVPVPVSVSVYVSLSLSLIFIHSFTLPCFQPICRSCLTFSPCFLKICNKFLMK